MLLSVLASRLFAATYYVDYDTGSDGNPGTSTAAPWKHCAGDPAATGIAAASTLAAGDVVLFKGGVSYVLTGTTGIALRWSGVTGSPITYDGNSAGTWGTGRARITDNYGAADRVGFFASTNASYLNFKSLEFTALGGAASLPADTGTALPARSGGGIAFQGNASNITIDGCVFRGLGYAFNAKPMSAASLGGTAITLCQGDNATISNCDFSRLTTGIDMSTTATLVATKITNCAFHDGVAWPFDLPASKAAGVTVTGCSETSNTLFDRASWSGYGDSPWLATQTAAAGTSVTLSASAIGLPTATFQWQKDGQPVSGATSATLSLASVASTDAGYYTVIATNSAGSSTSHEMALTITGGTATPPPAGTAPVFTTQPISQTVAPLGTATFTVAVSGSPAPTIQWFRNGVTFNGWTGTTLVLPGISTNDLGTYTSVATNSAGTVTSAPATLTISSTTTPPPPSDVAPTITTQPISQTVAPLTAVTFTVAASGSPTPTIQWFRNAVAIVGATSASLTLPSVATTDAGSYTAVAANSAGSITSAAAILTVTAPSATLPVFTLQPQSQSVTALSTVTLTAQASGSPAPTIQWFRNGTTFAGWTGNSLTLPGFSSNDVGTYTAVATNSAGSTTSAGAVLSLLATPPPAPTAILPAIMTQPVSQTVSNHASVTFTVTATGTPAPTYQWFRNGTTFPGWTAASLTLSDVTRNDEGTYTVKVTNAAGTVTSAGAVLTVNTRAPKAAVAPASVSDASGSRLINLSVRAAAGTGDDSLIIGFVLAGEAEKSLLIRGSGPALTAFGVPAALADPTLALFSGNTQLAANDDWTASTDAASISTAATSAGAFALATDSRDAALLTRLGAGAYTGQISGKDGAAGTALVEVYDLAGDSSARLVNLAVRSVVKPSGEAPIIGFVVAGTEPKKLLVRAVGPSLAAFGITNALSDPQLEIFAGSTAVQRNDNWDGSSELADAFARVGAFGLGETASKDAAMIVTVPPGAYTAVVGSANQSSGTVLVEIYELP